MRNILPDNQMRAMAMAMAGAVVAAVATMFVPAAVLEGLAGSTGLSEIFEVAKPPLGDTARAVIAFGAGALTLAVLAFILLRHERPVGADVGELLDDEAPSPLRHLLTKIEIPKMPWVKGEDDITELSDLPKLKNGDVHPDAPPRRPLSAHDLPAMDSAEGSDVESVAETPTEQVPVEIQEAAIIRPLAEAEPVPSIPAGDFKPSLADMVAQLEAAVAERKKQLADLEMVAAQLGAGRSADAQPEAVEQAVPVAPMQPPQYETIPSSAAKNEPVDAALAAALATLHRMNDGAR